MKRCKHCKHLPVCAYNYDKTKNDHCEDSSDVPGYSRKRRLWFAWWIPKVLILALVLGGCVTWTSEKTLYENGELKSVKASMTQCLTDSNRTLMKFKIPDLGTASVGMSVLDAESLAEIIKALPAGIKKQILILLGVE